MLCRRGAVKAGPAGAPGRRVVSPLRPGGEALGPVAGEGRASPWRSLDLRGPAPGHGLLQPGAEAGSGRPAQHPLRARRVEVDLLHLAGPRRLVLRLACEVEGALELAEDLVHRGADPGPDVDHLAAAALERQHVGFDHVVHVDVVALRLAAAEDA